MLLVQLSSERCQVKALSLELLQHPHAIGFVVLEDDGQHSGGCEPRSHPGRSGEPVALVDVVKHVRAKDEIGLAGGLGLENSDGEYFGAWAGSPEFGIEGGGG